MIKGYYQRCYTNTETSGWVPVAVSPDIPESASEFCAKNIQGKNSQISNNSVDEKNNVLNLFECDSDNDYLYLTHTQYGLISRDRPNMFSQSYIIPWNDERIKDPGTVLTLADSNFCDNESDALAEISEPEFLAPFKLQDIIAKYDISKDNLRLFIGAIINQFSKRKSDRMPLFIQYDGSELQLKVLLYLIFKLIPRFMRKQISAASCDSPYTREKPLIFSIKASTKFSYVDVFTGRNNVLDDGGLRKLKKNKYPFYAVDHYDTIDIDQYFMDLEDITVKMTGNAAANRLALQVSHNICTGTAIEDMDEYSSIDMFYNVLDLDSQTDYYFNYLAKCFKRAVECNIELTEEAEKALVDTINQDPNEESEFHQTYLDYEVKKVSAMEDSEAGKYLNKIDKNLALAICRSLLSNGSDEGRKKKIENYYIQHRLKVNTFDSLYDVIIEMISIDNLVKGNENLNFLFRNKLSEFFDKYIYNADYAFFDKYKDLLKKLYSESEAEVLIFEKKKDFWDKLTFEKIKFDKKDFYQFMAQDLNIDNIKLLMKYISLPECYYVSGTANYITEANIFFNDEAFKLYYEIKKEEAINTLVKYFANKNKDEGIKERCYTMIATLDPSYAKIVDDSACLLFEAERSTDYPKLIEQFRNIIRNAKSKSVNQFGLVSQESAINTGIIINNLCDALLIELHEQDAHQVVPLDMWLEIGNALLSGKYPNPFKILEDEKPHVLEDDPVKVYEESSCLKDSQYILYGNQYVSGVADERISGIVKKWMKLSQNDAKEDGVQMNPFDQSVRPAHVNTSLLGFNSDPDFLSEDYENATPPAETGPAPAPAPVPEGDDDGKKSKKGFGEFFNRFKKG